MLNSKITLVPRISFMNFSLASALGFLQKLVSFPNTLHKNSIRWRYICWRAPVRCAKSIWQRKPWNFFVTSWRPWSSSLHGLNLIPSERQQIVEINGVRSDLMQLSCGAPQGSLLGPLLNLCYSNDMVTSVKHKLLLCADGSVIISSNTNPDMIARDLSLDLKSCINWLINNKLSCHVGKTELILFRSRKQLKQAANFHVSYNGYEIQPVSSLKYLGVLINQHLLGQAMVETILKKATGRLKFLYRHTLYFNQKLCKNLCSALLQCHLHLDYCCTSWFHGLSQYHQQKLQIFPQ